MLHQQKVQRPVPGSPGLEVSAMNHLVPRNLWALECSASPGEIHQPQAHPKGEDKLIKTKPLRSEWSAGGGGLLFHYANTF